MTHKILNLNFIIWNLLVDQIFSLPQNGNLNLNSNSNNQVGLPCVDISPQAILGFNANCNIQNGENCESQVSFDQTYNTDISHVMCKMTHMCLMLEEDELVGVFKEKINVNDRKKI